MVAVNPGPQAGRRERHVDAAVPGSQAGSALTIFSRSCIMGRPVIAYHIIFGAYGFWLPNDPRGSQSKYVFAPRLSLFGPPTRVREDTRLSPAEAERLRVMQAELQRPPVRFAPPQIDAIGEGFGQVVSRLGLVFYAAALMPDHVHVVAARQEMYAEDIAGYLKRAGSRQLRKAGVHPFASQQRRRVVAAVNPGVHAGSAADQRRVNAAVNPGVHAGNDQRRVGAAVNPSPQAGRRARRVGVAANPGAHAGNKAQERLPSPWGEHGWKVFLFDLDEIEHAVTYVRDNPAEAGLPPQSWPWVKEYDG
jgi:hypothetical protein